MTALQRTASATWNGTVEAGQGQMSATSGVLSNTPYSFATRFENQSGTNPEELIAAAHATCYSMALTLTLNEKGYQPNQVHTQAKCTIESQNGGFKITKMYLETQGDVAGLDAENFQKIAQAAEQICPVSSALRSNVAIDLKASLA